MAVYISGPFSRAPFPELQMYPDYIPPPNQGQVLEYDRLYREYMDRRCTNPQYYYVYPGDRIFRPSMLGFGDHAKVSPVDVVNYNTRFTLAHPTWIDDRWNRFEDPATVIIHTASSFTMSSSSASSAICSSPRETHAGSSSAHARSNSSWAMYHGPGSTHNRSGSIPTFLPQSKPHADLYAAGMALEHFRNFILPCLPPLGMMWRNAIIVTDSAYLLSCLTQNIEAWRLNGYKNAKKKVVSNAQTIRWLEDLVENLEKNCVSVVFWKVDKKENPDAASMAKRALERQDLWDVENQVPLNDLIPPPKGRILSGPQLVTVFHYNPFETFNPGFTALSGFGPGG